MSRDYSAITTFNFVCDGTTEPCAWFLSFSRTLPGACGLDVCKPEDWTEIFLDSGGAKMLDSHLGLRMTAARPGDGMYSVRLSRDPGTWSAWEWLYKSACQVIRSEQRIVEDSGPSLLDYSR